MIEDWKIRERAYQLWEKDDRPEGSEEFYWYLAQEQLEVEILPPTTDTASSSDLENSLELSTPTQQAPEGRDQSPGRFWPSFLKTISFNFRGRKDRV